MKTIDHFQQNRPVHLARRDVYFECAAKLIHEGQQQFTPEIDMKLYEEILFLLRVARRHGGFAIRESGRNEKDEQFVRFINLLAGNVKAVLSMMNLKKMVDNSEGSFLSFLGANQASIALQAEEYQRRANDILRALRDTLKLAEDAFGQLKATNAESMGDDERTRYATAREHFTELVRSERHRYKIAPRANDRSHF